MEKFYINKLLERDGSGFSYLSILCERGEKYKINKFLKDGLDINQLLECNRNMLHGACGYGNQSKLVKFLIKKGIDVNVKDTFHGHTPIVLAASWGNDNIVNILLDAGADPSTFNKYGCNIFHGIGDLSYSTFLRLQSYGIDPTLAANYPTGNTPLEWANDTKIEEKLTRLINNLN